MFGKLAAIPVVMVLIDMWLGLVLNVTQSLNTPNYNTPAILPTVPDMAFNWLQVMVNASMVVTLTFALSILLQWHRALALKQAYELGPFRILGLVLSLAFSLPALYGFLMAMWQLAQGHWVISLESLRYVLTALCMVWCALLCLSCGFTWWRRRKKTSPSI